MSVGQADQTAPRVLDYAAADNSATGQTFSYFGLLALFIYVSTPIGYLVDIQTAYMLKNQLHADPTAVSVFRLVTAVPVYVAFLAGLVRDHWSPLRLRDRGYFLLFAPLTAIAFILMAVWPLSYAGLLVGMLVVMVLSRFLMAAFQGLIALVGQERLMSGRLSVVWNVVMSIPYFAAAFTSGFVSDHLRPKATFLLVAGLTLCIGLIGLWKPRSVYSHAYDKPTAKRSGFLHDVGRLLRHRAVYPAVCICFLWNFGPGMNTPLQFYLTNDLHAPDSVYSYFTGIFSISFIPTFLLYAFLCKRVALNKLLWWGTLVAVPQLIPLGFIHSANLALALAVPIGLMGGVATAAYFDLAMRSCPPGLQGTLMMLVDGMFFLSSRGGDLLGAAIYKSSPAHGFLYCVIATTAVYALILPVILLVPRELIATAEGQPNAAVQGQVPEGVLEG
jgi:hypothetical protein